jgi:hypothetical protein
MLNPYYDAIFLRKLAAHMGLKELRHDDSPQAPRPYTANPLKSLKNAF